MSLPSSAARSSKDVSFIDQRSTMSSYMAIPRLSAAEVLYGSSEGKLLLILDIYKIGFLLLLVFLLLYVGFIGITSL